MAYLRNDQYHVLTMEQDQKSVTWNGHTWPEDYTCEIVEERPDSYGRLARTQVHLSCGHWTDATARFCPHCGRAIVVRL